MPKRKHVRKSVTPPENIDDTLGLSPAVLAKRIAYEPEVWCPKVDPMTKFYDPCSDPHRPKTIHYSDVARAYRVIKKCIAPTRLMKSNGSSLFDVKLYFKLETSFKSGSFHERGAIYALHMLSDEQRKDGVVTASLGNWAMSLAAEGKKRDIPVTVFFPLKFYNDEIRACKSLGAQVELIGKTLSDTSRAALTMIQDGGSGTYINGYDHPHVIAGEGTIAIEILEQMPETEVILVPVGGGGLIAGIAAVVKKIRPDILVYGVETEVGNCFSKALENGSPCTIDVGFAVSVPTAGYNAFQTARPLIDKMIVVEEDWISQAIAHLVEEERLVVQRMGAVALAALFSEPLVAPELRSKNVVCILSGSNIDKMAWPKAIQRSMIIEGRLVAMGVLCPYGDPNVLTKVFRVLLSLKCNILYYYQENSWEIDCNVNDYTVTVVMETSGWRHADTIKHVMNKLFPGTCTFSEEFYTKHDKCQCYPKLWNI